MPTIYLHCSASYSAPNEWTIIRLSSKKEAHPHRANSAVRCSFEFISKNATRLDRCDLSPNHAYKTQPTHTSKLPVSTTPLGLVPIGYAFFLQTRRPAALPACLPPPSIHSVWEVQCLQSTDAQDCRCGIPVPSNGLDRMRRALIIMAQCRQCECLHQQDCFSYQGQAQKKHRMNAGSYCRIGVPVWSLGRRLGHYWQLGRVVKARHSKCRGVSPHRFKSCSCRLVRHQWLWK